jgi:lipopolysaccharide transport system permease protein
VIRRVWSHRDLLLSLARRNYQLRYRQSFAGVFWAIVPPVVSVGVATLVFHRVARVDTGSVPYPVFAFAALAPWTFFANSLTYATGSVVQSQAMISRLPFPRAVLPLSMCATVLIDLLIACATFTIYAYVSGAALSVTALWFPILLLIEVVLTVGLVLVSSALNVFVRDIRLGVPFLAQALLFVTPVMYPMSSVPDSLAPWFRANPLTGLVESFRDVLIEGRAPDIQLLLPAVIGAIAALVVGSWYFSSTERRFADVV